MQSSVSLSAFHFVVEGFWLKHANCLASISGISALIRMTDFMIVCIEALDLAFLFVFFANLLSGYDLLFEMGIHGKILF